MKRFDWNLLLAPGVILAASVRPMMHTETPGRLAAIVLVTIVVVTSVCWAGVTLIEGLLRRWR